jgi:flavorubredoxin
MKRLVLLCVLLFPLLAFSQVRILIAYDTQTGNTEKLAQSIAKGATMPGVEAL